MAGTPERLLALDANVLFDLAAEKDFAHSFREQLQGKGFSFLVPPTVVQELVNFMDNGGRVESALSRKALESMLSWGIKPFDLVGVGHAISEQFYERLVRRGLLPEQERHDGFILAETALRFVPVLATCDRHLLGIDQKLLKAEFEDAGMYPVIPAHPRDLWKTFR